MANRYFAPSLPATGACELDGELVHHLRRVLRCRPGDRLRLGDGRGATADAIVEALERDRVRCRIEALHREPPPPVQLRLAFAMPRLPRLEWLLEHGTEVGVAEFQPLWTQRSRPQGERPERWQRLLVAAAGQCDRAWLPRLHPAVELADFLADDAVPPMRLLGDPRAAPWRGPLAPGGAALLVGPEGGFTDDERAAAAARGYAAVSFGRHTLRTETAALVGAALLLAP